MNNTFIVSILDTIVELNKEDCQSYEALCLALDKKSPQDLKDKLANTSQEDIAVIFSNIILEAELKFDVPNLVTSLHQAVLQNGATATTCYILGFDVEFSIDDCRSYEAVCDHLATKSPIELRQKLSTLSSSELEDTMDSLLNDLDSRIGLPFEL